MALGRGPHLLEQLGGPVRAQRLDPIGELVADPLELPERQQPRAGLRGGGSPGARGLAAGKRVGQRARQLALEPGDLVAHVTAGGALAGERSAEATAGGEASGRDRKAPVEAGTGPGGTAGLTTGICGLLPGGNVAPEVRVECGRGAGGPDILWRCRATIPRTPA